MLIHTFNQDLCRQYPEKSTKSGLVESYFGSQGLVLSGGGWEIGEESQLECGCYKAHAGDDIIENDQIS